jgi:hypothetical protein
VSNVCAGLLQVPRLVRDFSTIEKAFSVDLDNPNTLPQFRLTLDNPLRKSSDPFFNMPDSNKMHLLEDLISDHFIKLNGAQVLEDRALNTLTLRTLSILGRLTHFGFYGTLHEVKDLVLPLMDTLDARMDVDTHEDLQPLEFSMHSDEERHDDNIALAGQEVSHNYAARWESVSPQSYLVLRSKEQMIGEDDMRVEISIGGFSIWRSASRASLRVRGAYVVSLYALCPAPGERACRERSISFLSSPVHARQCQ